MRPGLPKGLAHLAWLGLDTDEGREYWAAMQLMGRYSAANHALIHAAVSGSLGLCAAWSVENHHNFAWEEVLRRAGVRLLSAGVDEAPMAYKDIRTVMAAQRELVRIRGTFTPRIVKMAG